MSVSLCNVCYPEWQDKELLTPPPGMLPCAECGKYDDRYNGGLRVNVFRQDPRQRQGSGTYQLERK